MRFTEMELKEQEQKIRLFLMAIAVEMEEILEELEQVVAEETQEYCKLQLETSIELCLNSANTKVKKGEEGSMAGLALED